MNRREFVISIVLAIILAVVLTVTLNSSSLFRVGRSTAISGVELADDTADPNNESIAFASTATSTISPTEITSVATPSPTPLEVGSERGDDLEDVLLFYDSNDIKNFDINFCKIAEYYGLLCKRIPLDNTYLTDELLRDKQGNNFKLVGISAVTLLKHPQLLSYNEIGVIKSAIEIGGVNLLVSKVNVELDPGLLVDLTDGAVLGVNKPQDTKRDWIVSSAAPEITREFTDQVISSSSKSPQNDYALLLGQSAFVTSLISSRNDEGVIYPIFIRLEAGVGSIFIDAGDQGESLVATPLRELYYRMNDWNRGFAQVIPLMFTIRYSLGEEAWHSTQDYANLTIDDPTLTEPWHNLNYQGLFREMEAHNFHTTIAMHPVSWFEFEPDVAALFLANPNRYSLVQHGNNGDGYEFYRYDLSTEVEYEGRILPPRPLVDQEADIVQGLARMEQHKIFTGIPFDRIMIFPWGISPEPTLELLKKYNFLATVNAQDLPLDATTPSDWDFGMYPAIMDFGNFPMFLRRHPGTYQPFQPWIQPFIFDLFLDKPALFYSHQAELFVSGIDTFNSVADQVNGLTGEVEWRSLGDIISHLYLEKTNDDGSVDIKMYGNHLYVTNESSVERTYHILKEETLNVPISSLTVNGHEFPYRIEGEMLTLNVSIPVDSTVEILIRYGD